MKYCGKVKSIFLLGLMAQLCYAHSAISVDDPFSSVNSGASSVSDSSDADKGVNASIQQDSLLLVVGQLKSFFSFSEDKAVALELDGGPRVFRGNGTYGFALDDNTRVKFTAEYLKESLDFDFYSGATRQWVQQGAVGASYEYLLREGVIKNVAVGGHYSHAQSKDLPDITVAESNGGYWIDQRHIAGGNDLNGNAEAAIQLWKDGVVTLGPDYDQVHYNTKYEIQDGQNAQGLGGHIRLEQSLKDNLQLQAQTTLSQLFDNYAARLNWIWNSKQNRALSAGLNSSYTQDHTTERNFWVNGVNVSVIWDTPSVKKAAMPQNKVQNTEATESLSKWVQTPAVRLPDVLAISDERITQVGGITPFVSVTGFCPAASDVQYDSITRTYGASGGWYQSYPQNQVLQYDVISFNSANITAGPPGKAACLYGGYQGAVRVSLVLENNIYKNATGTGGNWIAGYSTLWPPALPPPVSYCQAIPNGCQFTTVAP